MAVAHLSNETPNISKSSHRNCQLFRSHDGIHGNPGQMAARAGHDSLGNLSSESERDRVGEPLCVDLVAVIPQFSHRLMAAGKWLRHELLACYLLYWLI